MAPLASAHRTPTRREVSHRPASSQAAIRTTSLPWRRFVRHSLPANPATGYRFPVNQSALRVLSAIGIALATASCTNSVSGPAGASASPDAYGVPYLGSGVQCGGIVCSGSQVCCYVPIPTDVSMQGGPANHKCDLGCESVCMDSCPDSGDNTGPGAPAPAGNPPPAGAAPATTPSGSSAPGPGAPAPGPGDGPNGPPDSGLASDASSGDQS